MQRFRCREHLMRLEGFGEGAERGSWRLVAAQSAATNHAETQEMVPGEPMQHQLDLSKRPAATGIPGNVLRMVNPTTDNLKGKHHFACILHPAPLDNGKMVMCCKSDSLSCNTSCM